MELVIEARGPAPDAALESFLRTTVVFAAWHTVPRVRRVHVRLEREDATRSGRARCTLTAEREGGEPAVAGATGEGVFEAVREASDLLEVALCAAPAPAPRLAA